MVQASNLATRPERCAAAGPEHAPLLLQPFSSSRPAPNASWSSAAFRLLAAASRSGPVFTRGGVVKYPRTAAAVVEESCDHYAENEVMAGLEFCPQLEALRPLLLREQAEVAQAGTRCSRR